MPWRSQRHVDSRGCAFLAATSSATLPAVDNGRSISAQRVVQSSAVGSGFAAALCVIHVHWQCASVFTDVIVLLAMYATPSSMIPCSLITQTIVVEALAIELLDESPVRHKHNMRIT